MNKKKIVKESKKVLNEKVREKANLNTLKKQVKGITLIALVVTIIVLLILAGVAISLTIGNNGIISRAINARDKTIVADEEEAITLAYAARKMDDYTKNVTASDLQEELSNANRDTRVTSSGDDLIVLYNDTNHRYRINQNGEIERLEDMTPELAKSVVMATPLGEYLCVELMDGTVGLIDYHETAPNLEQANMDGMRVLSTSGIKQYDDDGGMIVDNDGNVYMGIYNVEIDNYEIICLNNIEESPIKDKKIKKAINDYMLDYDGNLYYYDGMNNNIVNANPSLENKKIIDIFYYDNNSVVSVDEDGKIYEANHTCINPNHEGGLDGRNLKDIAYYSDSGTTIALDNNGKVYAWGDNYYGLLGIGALEDSSISICISDLENDMNGKNIVKIYNYSDTAFAIDSDGNAYNWGVNYSNIENYEIIRPTQILNGKNIKSILKVSGAIIVLDNDGKVYTWGFHDYGLLGNGTTEDSNTPICISENENNKLYGKTIEEIYKIDDNSVISKDSEGNIYGWGRNRHAELGNGTYENVLTPECFNEITTNKLFNRKVNEVLNYRILVIYILDDGSIIYNCFPYDE